MKKVLFLFSIILILFSCEQEDISTMPETEEIDLSGDYDRTRNASEIEFSKILASAMVDEEIRSFIKDQSLRKIDNDDDIVYHYVKDMKLASGKTFREVLATYCESQQYLDDLIEQSKLLTIFVPSLGTTFTPETWNIENVIPRVSTYLYEKEIPKAKLLVAFDEESNESFIDRYKQPDYPVLVVKTNERLVLPSQLRNSGDEDKISESNALTSENGEIIAYFIDDVYNNSEGKNNFELKGKNYIDLVYTGTGANMLKADGYKILKNDLIDRDYQYWGINPKEGANQGTINYDYKEFLWRFKINSEAVIGTIKDSPSNPLGDWSDGIFEIYFDFVAVEKEGSIKNVRKVFNEKISDFYDTSGNLSFICEDVDIFTWDSYKYGDLLYVYIQEYDAGNTFYKEEKVSTNFTQNYKIEPSVGIGIVKIGTSANLAISKTTEATYRISSTEESDDLGVAVINYHDKGTTSWRITNTKNLHTSYLMSRNSNFDYLLAGNNDTWLAAPQRKVYNTGAITFEIITRKF